jgi:hypothetical protein
MSAAILDRLDVAFERARWRFPESPPHRIYLDEDDRRAFDEVKSTEWGGPVHCFSYRDVQIYAAKRSWLVTRRGCLVCIPKHVNPRTQAAA